MDIFSVFTLLGGLAFFLFGMNVMSNSLERIAGGRLETALKKMTSNPFKSLALGAGITIAIQSSSAMTVMLVGLVNSGIMEFSQTIGVIMGANIGTTITAQLVSLDVDFLAPVALGIGIVIYMFSNKPKHKNIAEILIGFGILFTGMDFMKEAVKPLAGYQGFTDMLLSFGHHPILGVLMGFAITAIVQSSSASMGMLIALASQGLIPITAALPILYGENIGTCVTSLISSIGASRNARRAAIMHLTFNVLGSMIFMFILSKPIVAIVTAIDPTDAARQIANAHTLFNILNVIVLLPFNKLIVKLALKLVPETKGEQDDDDKVVKYIDDRMIETPSIALANIIKETLRMGEKSKESLNAAMDGIVDKSKEKIELSFKREKLINELQKSILNYLLKLSKASLNEDSRETVDALFNTVNDIERIGDHAENIAELAKDIVDLEISFSDVGIGELKDMYNKVVSTYTYALEAMRTSNVELACKVIKMEEQVDMMEKSCRANHMNRLNSSSCSIESGVIYLDIISNLERVSDHAVNIAQQVIAGRIVNK